MLTKIIIAIMSFSIAVTAAFGLDYKAPEDEVNEVKNVIIMIGDGMGYNHIAATEDKYGETLDMMSRTEYHGYSKTRSASNAVTDSAAGGTALSTGQRTKNGCVGTYYLDQHARFVTPANITEIAAKYEMSTGIVTTDTITGATPASFSAHEYNRSMYAEIFADQVAADIDLIWGSIDTAVVSEAVCEENGKEYITTLSQVKSLESGVQSIGQFDADTLWQGTKEESEDQPTLSELTEEAIEILSADEDGFFLMVEGAHIDKRSHAQDGDGAMAATYEFDNAVSEALDFAEKDGNTLVIITADHETGRVTPNCGGGYSWKSDGHTNRNVPVLVYGADGFIKQGETLKNREISERAVAYMTNNTQAFPCPTVYLNK